MTRWLILAEGTSTGAFDPLDQLRPPFLLRNGAWTVAERWIRLLGPTEVSAAVRPWLGELIGEQSPWRVNGLADGGPDDVWVIVGTPAPRLDSRWDDLVFPSRFAWSNGHDAVLRLDCQGWNTHRDRLSAWVGGGGAGPAPPAGDTPRFEDAPLSSAAGLWDLVNHLHDQMEFDWVWWRKFHGRGEDPGRHRHESAVVIEPDRVWIGQDVEIGPLSVIDARSGPVILDKGVVIEPMVRLDGPAYVGPHTRLVGGKTTGGCAFGPGCRVGGEVEASIFQGFSNKVHEGFFGHAFIGEWVNLGALTTNSDLKNNYGSVRVVRDGQMVDTGCLKVGSYLSDHTKTAIGTLLPTGATTGVGVNLLSGGLAPKSVPPFVWGGSAGFAEHRIDRMVETAQAAMKRRAAVLKTLGRADQLGRGEENALRALFAASASTREAFLRDGSPQPGGRP